MNKCDLEETKKQLTDKVLADLVADPEKWSQMWGYEGMYFYDKHADYTIHEGMLKAEGVIIAIQSKPSTPSKPTAKQQKELTKEWAAYNKLPLIKAYALLMDMYDKRQLNEQKERDERLCKKLLCKLNDPPKPSPYAIEYVESLDSKRWWEVWK